MARLPQNPKIDPRTERTDLDGVPYVIVAGAPKHYIAGFGVVGPGDTVTLASNVKPGRWLEPISDSDVAKLSRDPGLAMTLAEAAADRKRDNGVMPADTVPGEGELVTKGAGVPVSDDAAAAGGTPTADADAEAAGKAATDKQKK